MYLKANEVTLIHLAELISKRIPKDSKFEHKMCFFLSRIDKENNIIFRKLTAIHDFIIGVAESKEPDLRVYDLTAMKRLLKDVRTNIEVVINQIKLLLKEENKELAT